MNENNIKVVECGKCEYAFCNHFENGNGMCICRRWSKLFDTTLSMKQNDYCSYGVEKAKEN